MSQLVICGSIAANSIMKYSGDLDTALKGRSIGQLDVSFIADSCKVFFGGTAVNTSYNLALLQKKPILFGSVGYDFCLGSLKAVGVDVSYVKICPDEITATCNVLFDNHQNQIATFYPGAMKQDIYLSLKELPREKISMVLINPGYPPAMVKWVKECICKKIPYLFNPGLSLEQLTVTELLQGIQGAEILILNHQEYQQLLKKTSLTEEKLREQVSLLVITNGQEGSMLKRKGIEIEIPSISPEKVIDPIGTGDAYTAGLMLGFLSQKSLKVMGRLGSIAAVYAVERQGCIEHRYTFADFQKRYRKCYGAFPIL